MSTTTEPTITHPAWCGPEHCHEERQGDNLFDVSHGSTPMRRTVGVFDGIALEIYLTRADPYDDEGPGRPSHVHLRAEVGSANEPTVDGLEDLGAWLVAHAAGYCRAIATEGDPEKTVLDEDLNLTVSVEGESVVMTGDPADDGTWYFGIEEARELAAALIDHADRLDSTCEGGAQ